MNKKISGENTTGCSKKESNWKKKDEAITRRSQRVTYQKIKKSNSEINGTFQVSISQSKDSIEASGVPFI